MTTMFPEEPADAWSTEIFGGSANSGVLTQSYSQEMTLFPGVEPLSRSQFILAQGLSTESYMPDVSGIIDAPSVSFSTLDSFKGPESTVPSQLRFYEQVGVPPTGEQGIPGPPERTAGAEGIRVVPIVTISERYDSNVFLSAAQRLDDFVTSMSPAVRVDHQGRLVEGSVLGGLTGEAYVNNPGLNYIGGNGSVNLRLDRLVGQAIRGAGLQLTDNFMYTPQPPAFLAPESGNQLGSAALVRGIQAARANSFTNMGMAAGSLAVTPSTTLQATYTHQMIRFYNSFVSTAVGGFFNTNFQSVSVGPQYALSPSNTLGLLYQYSKMDFTPSTGGATTGIETQGGAFNWRSTLTRTLSVEVTPGFAWLPSSKDFQYTANALLRWSPQRGTTVSLNYSRGVFPSFFAGGVPIISDALQASLSQALTSQFAVTGLVNYARSQSVPPGILEFDSFGPTLTLSYQAAPAVTVSASASHNEFQTVFLGTKTSFDRETFMLSVRAEWR